MSQPRRALGPGLPGKLVATQLRVLAAELSDAARLSRGKRYWADGAVVDIDVRAGTVTAIVQGARPQPYRVVLEARPGRGAPTRRELHVSCTCPDDEGTGRHGCKHVVAALFQLSEEVSIDPELVPMWRRSHEAGAAEPEAPDDPPDDDPSDDDPRGAGVAVRGHVAPVVPLRRSSTPAPAPRPPHELDALLRVPAGAALPDIPSAATLGRCLHPPLGHLYLDAVLLDALGTLDLWSDDR